MWKIKVSFYQWKWYPLKIGFKYRSAVYDNYLRVNLESWDYGSVSWYWLYLKICLGENVLKYYFYTYVHSACMGWNTKLPWNLKIKLYFKINQNYIGKFENHYHVYYQKYFWILIFSALETNFIYGHLAHLWFPDILWRFHLHIINS